MVKRYPITSAKCTKLRTRTATVYSAAAIQVSRSMSVAVALGAIDDSYGEAKAVVIGIHRLMSFEEE